MDIIGRNAELNKFSAILEDWSSDGSLWVHLHGESGSGKTHLINHILQNKLSDFILLFRFNFEPFSLSLSNQFREIFRSIFKEFPADVEMFSRKFPRYLGRAIFELFNSNFENSTSYSLQFQFELLAQLLTFLLQQRRGFIILENVDFADNYQTAILTKILSLNSLSALLITSSEEEQPRDDCLNLIRLEKLSATDIRKFVGSYLSIGEESALFITNHLQMKSKGIPRNIKFLLESYYRKLLPENPDERFNPKILQRLRISPVPETIFSHLARNLTEFEIAIFSFLSRLADPMSISVLRNLLSGHKADEDLIKIWIEKDYLKAAEFAGEKYVYIGWEEWRGFLSKNQSLKELDKILGILSSNSDLQSLKYPLQLSNLYFEIGDKKTAIKLAHDEAKFLNHMGFEQRALERYNFLRRNLSEYAESDEFREMIYKETGELQKSLGLYESAFESFREMRDRPGKESQRIWFDASLRMAEILLKMDAIAEARYLLNDLKIKKAATPFAKAFSHVLLGDLEKNLGRNDYALMKFEKAFSLLDKTFEPEFIYQVYSKLRFYYLKNKSADELQQLFTKANRLISSDSRIYFLVNLDVLKLHMDRKEVDLSIELALKLYRKTKQNFHPSIMAQIILYLVDIYAFLSKWHLARSHLTRLLQIRLFITHKGIEARILIGLAVIEKEIAQYGKALKLLSRAEEISRNESLYHELNEIKLHKGHIQLLIHGYLRQREFLADVLRWAVENHDAELFLMASLYMSSYELQQMRLKEAKEHLDEARIQIGRSGNEIDRLNYIFYLLQFLLETDQFRRAERILEVWERKSSGIAKFENLAIWFKAKLLFKQGEYKKSLAVYRRALMRSKKYHLPHLEFHILKEMVILCHDADFQKELKLIRMEAIDSFRYLLETIGDEILRKQFHESREVGELVKIGIELD